MKLDTPYKKRPIRFLGSAEIKGWRLKVYGTSAFNERPPEQMVDAAMNVASERLPTPAVKIGKAKDDKGVSDDRYGVAILIVHEGREGVFALVSWWVGENMLQHHVYFSSSDFPCSFEYISPSGIAACVWEMEVLAFERDAWVEHVLANPSGPNLEMYLTRQLNADV